MAYNNIYRAIRGIVKRDTGKAILFVAKNPEAITPEDEELEAWLPKSQLRDIITLKDGSGDSIVMASEWILKQKDWMHLPTAAMPTTPTPAPVHPQVPSTPPAKSFVDMDDDIPF